MLLADGAPSAGRLLAEGKVANLDALASATSSITQGGAAHGCRAIDLRVAGGVDLRVLPDRGLDIGTAWFGGLPLAWLSAVGERGPLDHPQGTEWLDAFGGGLITTCGLRNVGPPTSDQGLHGQVSHLRAGNVRVGRWFHEDDLVLEVCGVIDEVSAPGGHLQLERRVRTRTGSGLIELEDLTTNRGSMSEAAPILYHVNVGPPLLDTETTVEVTGEGRVPRDEESERELERWSRPGDPEHGAGEIVLEHVLAQGGRGEARVINRSLGVALTLSFDRAGLPYLCQWLHRGHGVFGLALEPTNSPLAARRSEGFHGPMLEPGASRTTRLTIAVAAATE